MYGKVSINTKITKNLFSLLEDVNSKRKRYSAAYHLNSTSLTKLRAAVTHRRDHARMLFQSEIFSTAQSLSVDEKSLYHGTKAALLKGFEKVAPPVLSSNAAIIIKLSAIIRFLSNIKVDTFNAFAIAIYTNINNIYADYQRIDVLCDRYFENSLKNQTRSERGCGSSINFDGQTPFPKDFCDNFLKNSKNKEKLNHFLADKLYSLHDNDKCIVITKGGNIVTNDVALTYHQFINNFPSEQKLFFASGQKMIPIWSQYIS